MYHVAKKPAHRIVSIVVFRRIRKHVFCYGNPLRLNLHHVITAIFYGTYVRHYGCIKYRMFYEQYLPCSRAAYS